MCHQASGSTHANEKKENLLNKDNSPMTRLFKNILQLKPPHNNFFSNFDFTRLNVATIDAMVIGFNRSKHTIKTKTTTLTSYSNANQITFPHPTKFFTMCKDLKHGSNMIAIILYTCHPSKDLKNPKKLFDYLYCLRLHIHVQKRGSQLPKGQRFKAH